MASHVVVVDATARRANIKTTPTKHLSDVLQEACAKFGLNADQYTLKFNNKPVDLSRTIRLAALPQGAKLDLVQASRSPSVVNVALQTDQPGQRFTHKFPSTTSLWQVLRVFETVVESKPNFTQRGVAVMKEGSTGSGRMNYEMPVINIMGRELATFVDLQKTLSQLGFGSGSALLRLRFKDSGSPLEEAMEDITKYFKSVETPEPPQTADAHGAHAGNVGESQSAPEPSTAAPTEDIAGEENPQEPTEAMEDVVPTNPAETTPAPEAAPTAATAEPDTVPPNTVTGPDQRPLLVYLPSSSSTPSAARNTTYNENDYIPTIDHAKAHQAQLQSASRNKRLASDAELAAQAQAKADKLAAIKSVTIRVRLPDTAHIESPFSNLETAQTLYAHVRSLLSHPDQPFVLKYPNPKGPGLATLKEGPEKLVADLGLQGRVLVSLMWEPGASVAARRDPSLKREWAEKGREIRVVEPPREVEEQTRRVEEAPREQQKKKSGGGGDKEARLKKLLGFGKK